MLDQEFLTRSPFSLEYGNKSAYMRLAFLPLTPAVRPPRLFIRPSACPFVWTDLVTTKSHERLEQS